MQFATFSEVLKALLYFSMTEEYKLKLARFDRDFPCVLQGKSIAKLRSKTPYGGRRLQIALGRGDEDN